MICHDNGCVLCSSGQAEHTQTAMTGQTQYGGQNYSGTSATMNWGIRDIPTPREMVAMLDQWVVGQPAAKKVGVRLVLVQLLLFVTIATFLKQSPVCKVTVSIS